MAANDPEIERAVRAYFDALASGDDVAPFAAGPYALVRRVVRPRAATVDIHRLTVVEDAGTHAVVDFDATLDSKVDLDYGTVESRLRYGGPLTVMREGSEWKVVDYAISGRLRSDSLQLFDGELTNGNLRLHVTSLELRGDATVLDAVLENRGTTTVGVGEVRRAARVAGRWWWIALPMWDFPRVGPGESAPLRVGWTERYPLSTRVLRFVVRGGETDGPGQFAFAFEIDRLPEPRVAPLDESPRERRLRPETRRLVVWGPYVVVALLIAFHRYRASAIVLAATSLVYLALFAVHARFMVWRIGQQRRRLLAGLIVQLGSLAFAGWLWWQAR
jgi:hypothetical protein